MDYVAPEFQLSAFNCPYCKAFAQVTWVPLTYLTTQGYKTSPYTMCVCTNCSNTSVWQTNMEKMVYPDILTTPSASPDMPEDVKAEYNEAANVLNKSPRSAAALLRQGLQKLMVHLGEPGKKINTDIRSLAAKEMLPNSIIRIADTMRLTGNDSVHPGEMLDEDRDHVATQMFKLLNIIVTKAITEPKEFDELYNMTPEHKRKAAEAQDEKAKLATQ